MEITYKVVLKGSSGNWNTPFSSLEDVYSHFDKERIKEINIYYKGKYMGKQSDVEKFKEGIKKISKELWLLLTKKYKKGTGFNLYGWRWR